MNWPKIRQVAIFAVSAVLMPLAVVSTAAAWRVITTDPRAYPGIDHDIMRELGRRWLADGTMYLPYQLAGPYSIDVTVGNLAATPALYPPIAGPVFAPVALLPWGLSAVLWWGVPLAILGYAFHRWRPAMWTWPLFILAFLHPMTSAIFMVGGTSLWAAALVAAGLMWHWPSALILVKPTLLPFALVGIRHRSWWIVATAMGVITLLGPWRDYITVAMNASESGGGIGYSLASVPLLMVPIVAYLGRTRREPVSASPSTPIVVTMEPQLS